MVLENVLLFSKKLRKISTSNNTFHSLKNSCTENPKWQRGPCLKLRKGGGWIIRIFYNGIVNKNMQLKCCEFLELFETLGMEKVFILHFTFRCLDAGEAC